MCILKAAMKYKLSECTYSTFVVVRLEVDVVVDMWLPGAKRANGSLRQDPMTPSEKFRGLN